MPSRHALCALLSLFVAAACGGKAVIDRQGGAPADDDGSGASAGASTSTAVGGGGSDSFTPDGIARPDPGGWQLRIVTFPISCPTADVPAPMQECNWYDIEIDIFTELVDGLVVTPDSGLGDSFFSVSEGDDPPSCSSGFGAGGLFGTVTIVDMQDDRVVVELGDDWGLVTLDPGLSPVGQHTLALCN